MVAIPAMQANTMSSVGFARQLSQGFPDINVGFVVGIMRK